ncbi:hypothetical protein ACFLXE_08125, partial [Chloroflexota bacterium]
MPEYPEVLPHEVIWYDDNAVFEQAMDRVDVLSQFLHVSKEYLAKAHVDRINDHKKYQIAHPWKMDYELSDGYIDDWLEDLGMYANTFPRFMYYSFVILAFTLFETEMRLIFRVMRYFGNTKLKWNKLYGT